jgi:hypothetical protein
VLFFLAPASYQTLGGGWESSSGANLPELNRFANTVTLSDNQLKLSASLQGSGGEECTF